MKRKPPERESTVAAQTGPLESALRQWPVQLKLVPTKAPYFQNADLLIAADCVPFAHGGFHSELLKDRAVIMFCPKLDQGIDAYVEKLAEIFKLNDIKSITIPHMEVPCCSGTLRVIEEALKMSGKDIPVETMMISVQGELLETKTW